MSQQEFWERVWTGFQPFVLNPTMLPNRSPSDKQLLDLMGDINRAEVLELGCGNGLLSVHLAMSGAKVTAIDNTPLAVANTQALAQFNHVSSSVDAHTLDAMDLGQLGKSFDLVVGEFILHHIEPLEDFAKVLFNILGNGGRGLFLENNSRNQILMICRKHLTGRWNIPKYSDGEEYPFEVREVELLARMFDRLELHYPEFFFFGLADKYLVRHRMAVLSNYLKAVDGLVYRYMKPLHKYSYHQIIEVQKVR